MQKYQNINDSISISISRVVSHVKSDASLMREAKAVTSSCPLPRDPPVSLCRSRDALKAFPAQNVLSGIWLGPYDVLGYYVLK